MSSRLYSRLLQLAVISLKLPQKVIRRKPKDEDVKRILVIHQLLLGDAVMATGLLANLRAKYPKAIIDVALPGFLVPLYSKNPYNVQTLGYSPKNTGSFVNLIKNKKYDLGFILGDARYSWAAYAIGTRWTVAHKGDYPAYKNWFVDELIPMPETITAMPDLMTDLCEPIERVTYSKEDWQIPDIQVGMPENPYIVFHIGASSSLKRWSNTLWKILGGMLTRLGYSIVVTCGPGEEELVKDFLNDERFEIVVQGSYSLLQMWKLIDHSSLLVSPDTGISHLAKVTDTPLVCLFGPGPAELVGHSKFFATHKARYLSKPIACRNQPVIFKRPVPWVKFCERTEKQCDNAKCIKSITINDVFDACVELLPDQ